MTIKERVHPNPVAKIAGILLIATILSLGMSILLPDLFLLGLPFIWGLAVLLCLMAYASTRFTTLEVTEDEIIHVIGVMSVRRKHIPYSKITDVSMRQSFIERIFSLGTLEIDTAGGPGTEIMIPSMPLNTLHRVMDEIKEESNSYRIPRGG